MSKENDVMVRGPRAQKGVAQLLSKLSINYPDREITTEEDLFEALCEHEEALCNKCDKLVMGQKKLSELFMSNPKMGAFISGVIEGEDPLLSCVRYFGKDVLECGNDAQRMEDLRRENDEYLRRVRNVNNIKQRQEENWQHTLVAGERFKQRKKMSDEEFETFFENVLHLGEHISACDIGADILEILYKAFNYDSHLHEATRKGEVRGRNERILCERRTSSSSNKTNSYTPDTEEEENDGDNLTPIFGLKRRKNVWDM